MKNMSNSENNSSFQTIIDSLTKKAQANTHKIGFPDALDIRVFKACHYLIEHSIAEPYLIGNPDQIQQMAKESSISIDNILLIQKILLTFLNQENPKVSPMSKLLLY